MEDIDETYPKVIYRYVDDYDMYNIFSLSQEAIDLYKKYTGNTIEDAYFLDRDDPYLLQVIDELGEKKASGEDSKLKIIDVHNDKIGVVYSPIKPQLDLVNDAINLYKKLSGVDFTCDIARHDEYLVKVIQKLGNRAVCYPIDMVEIDYISKEFVDSYIIDRSDDYENVCIVK